jgi:predicted glutamine amidotransferase
MCVIIALANGQELPDDKLKNATLNNPHGFGLVTIHDGKLEVYHKFDEKGNDPAVVARELEKRKDADWNYLHVRYCTRGDKSKENTHPFTVYKSKERRIEFMHNGSLSNKHTTTQGGTYTAGQPIKSDSRLYVEKYLSPMLYHWNGDNGIADIEDVFLENILEDHFSYTNRGLLVANDLEAMFLGKWDTTVGKNNEKIVVSNTDYFGKTEPHRMTEFYKPKMSDLPRFLTHGNNQNKEPSSQASSAFDEGEVGDQAHYPLGTAGTPSVKTAEAPVDTQDTATTSNPTQTTTSTTKTTGSTGGLHEGSSTRTERKGRKITPIKEVDLRKAGRFLQPNDIDGLFDTTAGELDDELICYIAMLSLTEFRSYVDVNPDGAARMLEHIFLRSASLIEDNEELSNKVLEANDRHSIASKRIANLTSTLKQNGVSVVDPQ